MVFMCRPNLLPNCLKDSSIWHQTKTIRCGIIFCMWENWSQSKRTFKLYALFIFAPKIPDLSFFWKLEAGGKPSTWFPPGGLVELITKANESVHKVFLNWSGSSSGYNLSLFHQSAHLNKENTQFPNIIIHRGRNEPTNYQEWIKDNLCSQFQ